MIARRISFAIALAAGAGAAGATLATLDAAGSPAECTVTAVQTKAPKGTTITGAVVVEAAAGVPRYCKVDGHVAVPGNEVNFRLGLPESWNGKYYFVGVGGLGGTIGNLNAALTRGYASASTDTGHQASDANWGANRAKEIDYGYRGTHVTAAAAKELTTAFFGKAPEHAYFNGCSNGGRQALMEVQRYPADFDGIIAGDPATGTPMQVGRALIFQQMLLHPEHYLPASKVDVLARATLEECDAKDGLKDGLISDPRLCSFKPEKLKCAGADGPDCLTAPQVETVRQIYTPVRTPDGKLYTTGFPVGHEDGATGWQTWIVGKTAPTPQSDGTLAFDAPAPSGYTMSESNLRFLATENDDPSFNWRTLKFPQDLPRLASMTEILSPHDADLRPFKKRGSKIILYHGWADPAISAYGTVDYYDRMTKIVGGQKEAEAFSRLYLVPGMHHCAGGPGPNSFDMLPALESWIEKGIAPAAVLASHRTDGKVDRTRPLCPYPQVAQYTGSGSIDEASSFRCVAP
ncbi:MAG TPA: tannase/feruloyl esterase family alpha/beta hydrolase [Vicinamibacterales bacterium]